MRKRHIRNIVDVEKLKSISGITSMWIEEASEIEQQDLQQLDLRLRGKTDHYKQIIITFNPISVLHWLKSYFIDIKRDNATTLKTTYKDNRFIDDEYKAVLESMKEVDEYYYNVYCLNLNRGSINSLNCENLLRAFWYQHSAVM